MLSGSRIPSRLRRVDPLKYYHLNSRVFRRQKNSPVGLIGKEGESDLLLTRVPEALLHNVSPIN